MVTLKLNFTGIIVRTTVITKTLNSL